MRWHTYPCLVRSVFHSWIGHRPHLRHGLRQTATEPRKRIDSLCHLPSCPVQGILAVSALSELRDWGTSRLIVHYDFALLAARAIDGRQQISCGTIFGVLMGLPAHWFKHKLGRAYGVMALGSSISGTVYPIIIKNLIQKVG